MGFLGTLLLFILVDLAITFLLRLLGVPYFVIDIVVAFVMAFLFAYLRRERTSVPFYKNLSFHRNFATIFIVLLAISYIFGQIL